MKIPDYYGVLGVSRGAGAEEIKRAWRRLARKYHPDVSREPESERRMKEINEAFEVLGDPDKRAEYDRLGAGHPADGEFTPPPGRAAGFAFSDFGDADFSDFFASVFGGRHGRGRTRPEFVERGRDEHATIDIDLEDSFRGATRDVKLQMHEIDETGRVRPRSRVLRVAIPRGVRPGQQIRLAGQGGRGSAGAPDGDLFLEVRFRPHPLYRIDGRDLYLTLPVAPWEAALGAEVRIPTPDGPVDLHIPANSSAGRKLRLKGRGIPGQPPGDLYAVLEIVLPEARSERAREIYRTMARELPFDPRRHLGV